MRAATGGVVGPSFFGSGNNCASVVTVGSIAGKQPHALPTTAEAT
jgi:hypothetical protein